MSNKALYAHTLNATAAAMPRLMVSLVENGAMMRDEGESKTVKAIRLPNILKRFWIGDDQQIIWV